MPKFLQAAAASAVRVITVAVAAVSVSSALAAPLVEPAKARNGRVAEAVQLVDRLRDGAADMVSTAMGLVGVRYRLGGTSAEHGFDCSGFTREVFEASIGLLLPRRAEQQAQAPGLLPVPREALQPGDLVFFNTLRRTFSHVGIYLGDGKFIHSPSKGGEVRVDDMRFVYWAKRFTGARRAETMADEPAARDGAAPGLVSLGADLLSAEPFRSEPLHWDWLDAKTLSPAPVPLRLPVDR